MLLYLSCKAVCLQNSMTGNGHQTPPNNNDGQL